MGNRNSTTLKPIDYERFDPARITDDGQISIFPCSTAKTRGGVINSVFSSSIQLNAPQEIDDVCIRDKLEIPLQVRVFVEYSSIKFGSYSKLNGFDWEVLDAIATLFTRPGELIYLDSIYRVIVGKKVMYPVTKKQRDMVDESIKKMMNLPVDLRLMDFYEKGSPVKLLLQNNNFELKNIRKNLIPCEIIESVGAANGFDYGIRLFDAPPLFTYAQTAGLVSLYPLALVDTPLPKTRNVIVLQSFLLRSIDQMYRDRAYQNESSNFITTKSIYSLNEGTKQSDTKNSRMREKAERLLDYWRQKKYIAGYQVVMMKENPNYIQGYQIYLSQKNRYWDLPTGRSERGTSEGQIRGVLPASMMKENGVHPAKSDAAPGKK